MRLRAPTKATIRTSKTSKTDKPAAAKSIHAECRLTLDEGGRASERKKVTPFL
jgi:hypothetical protein